MKRHCAIVSVVVGVLAVGAVLTGVFGQSGTTFAQWCQEHQISADTHADPDSDGLNNLLEYAFGGNPALADRPLPGEPVPSVVADDWRGRPGTQLYHQVRYRIAPGRGDIYVRPEISYSLTVGSWNHGKGSLRLIEDGEWTIARETRQVRPMRHDGSRFGSVPKWTASFVRGFMRVRVELL